MQNEKGKKEKNRKDKDDKKPNYLKICAATLKYGKSLWKIICMYGTHYYICMNTYIHTYTHIYIHTYAQYKYIKYSKDTF